MGLDVAGGSGGEDGAPAAPLSGLDAPAAGTGAAAATRRRGCLASDPLLPPLLGVLGPEALDGVVRSDLLSRFDI